MAAVAGFWIFIGCSASNGEFGGSDSRVAQEIVEQRRVVDVRVVARWMELGMPLHGAHERRSGPADGLDHPVRFRPGFSDEIAAHVTDLSLIHISEPTRQAESSYAVFCLK